jgi:hypothetical protein
MRRIAITLGLLTFFITGLISCKKESGDDDEECEISVASIAGKYKLVSCRYISGGAETDAIRDLYEACELDDVNELRADKTFTYTDGGVVCSPSGTTSGTWNVSGQTLILNSGFSVIESFNCSQLVVTFEDENSRKTVREVYQRQ